MLKRGRSSLHAVEEKGIPAEEKQAILAAASGLDPVELLQEFLNSSDLKEWVTVKDVPRQEATEQVKSGELDALVSIPEGFTYATLSHLFLGEASQGAFHIQAEEQSTEVNSLQEIMQNFVNTLNMQFALGKQEAETSAEPVLPKGGREVVEGVDGASAYTFAQYFTIAIGTLFALFMAQTVALKTVTEKREQVFNRIILTDRHPLFFLLGKSVSAFLLALMQFAITLTAVQLPLDVFPGKSFTFWAGVTLILIVFALTVGGLSALLTALTLHLNDSNSASGVSTMIIMGCGVLGGSFFPLDGLPEPIQKIGEWTPNGLTQTAIIEWVQYTEFHDLLFPILFLAAVCIICFAISLSIFPKRGRS